MSFDITVHALRDPLTLRNKLVADFSDSLSLAPEFLLQAIVSKIADRYIEEHYAEIAAAISPTVIAAVASHEMGAKVMDKLRHEIESVRSMAESAKRLAKR